MGNAPILLRPPPSPPAMPPVPPTALRSRNVVWRVYLMREGGAKLMRHAMVPTLRVGHLEINEKDGALLAALNAPGGAEIRRLDTVRVRRLTPKGSMLLQGFEAGSATAHQRQAWWCVMERE